MSAVGHLGCVDPRKGVPMLIDPRFTQFDASGLKFTVTRDPAKNEFVLTVERPRKKRE